MCGIRRNPADPTRQDQTFAARGAGTTLVRMSAMHDNRGMVERILKEVLIRIVADRRRHFAFAICDHAVGGKHHISFDASHGCGATFRSALDSRAMTASR